MKLITPDWPAPDKVKAFTTTRVGGFSTAPYNSFNLATHVDDDLDVVQRNRALLGQSLPSEPVWLNQTHSDRVELLTPGQQVAGDCDGTLTFDSNVVCTVMTADCLPVLITDKAGSFVAAVHAGWRGLVAGIIGKCLNQIPSLNPQDILVWLGPAIGPDAFEVGDDVRDVFVGLDEINKAAFKTHGQKWLCDIYQLAKNQLSSVGVTQIYGGKYCTFNDSENFYSYRRDGQCGRMASCLYLKRN